MKVYSASDIGLYRNENQDAVKCEEFEDAVFAVLCDGMGGENSGMDASRITVDAVFGKFVAGYKDNFDANSIRNLLLSSISAANSIVYNTAQASFDKLGMGTTCVAAFVKSDGTAYIANVGDSRAYVADRDGITQITSDHTVVQMLYDKGEIDEERMKTHPQRNMLIKAVGVEKNVKPDYFETELPEDSVLLLCSDGLSGYCNDEDIYAIISNCEAEDTADKLINLALKKSGKDNITVALIVM